MADKNDDNGSHVEGCPCLLKGKCTCKAPKKDRVVLYPYEYDRLMATNKGLANLKRMMRLEAGLGEPDDVIIIEGSDLEY